MVQLIDILRSSNDLKDFELACGNGLKYIIAKYKSLKCKFKSEFFTVTKRVYVCIIPLGILSWSYHSFNLICLMNYYSCHLQYIWKDIYQLKSDSHLPKKASIICLIESPLKIMKIAFYFILKAVFVLMVLNFSHDILVGRLTSQFMTSQPGLQTIATHIFSNISQKKGNPTLKFGQLTEYNKRDIFLQKLCRKWGTETSSRPLFIV